MKKARICFGVLFILAALAMACRGQELTPSSPPAATTGSTSTPAPKDAAAPLAVPTLTPTSVAPETIITFPDSTLERSIRATYGSADGAITKGALAKLTTLHLYPGVVDLTGIEHLVNLTSLNLEGAQINDLSPLASLTNLTFLVLAQNQITDISPLTSVTSLNYVDLEGNNLRGDEDPEIILDLQDRGVTVIRDR